MPAKSSLRKAISRYKRAKKSNAEHHNKAFDTFSHLGTTKEKALLLRKRAAQLRRLEKIPMFKRMLSRKQKIVFTVNCKKEIALLFKNGFTLQNSSSRFVLVLDSKLRGVILVDYPFYKKMRWAPMQVHSFEKAADGVLNIIKPYALGVTNTSYFTALSKQIELRENQMDFSASHSGRELRRIRKLL